MTTDTSRLIHYHCQGCRAAASYDSKRISPSLSVAPLFLMISDSNQQLIFAIHPAPIFKNEHKAHLNTRPNAELRWRQKIGEFFLFFFLFCRNLFMAEAKSVRIAKSCLSVLFTSQTLESKLTNRLSVAQTFRNCLINVSQEQHMVPLNDQNLMCKCVRACFWSSRKKI